MTHHRRGVPSLTLLTAGVAVALCGALAAPAASADSGVSSTPPSLTIPIGGGYETESLQSFARAAAERATGQSVRLVVVPSSYGNTDEERADNLRLAQSRTDQIDSICDAAVAAPLTCDASLAVLLNRADAMDPANAAAFADADGIYILGGDQGIAMEVLADSPAESAMAAAATRGAVVAGTSAGAAVQSRSMINGYAGDLNPWDGFRRGSTLMWWGDEGDPERGLSFGSTRAIFDQHFFQRGRFARLVSTIATSDEHFGGASPLGVGVDYGTGVHNTADRTLSGVFGPSGVAVVDFETLGASHRWVGDSQLLSARRILTHVLTPGPAAYDMETRRLSVDGAAVPVPKVKPWNVPAGPTSGGTLYLGGDVSDDFSVGVMPDFVRTATAATRTGRADARIVVLSANPGDTRTAQRYAAGLGAAGWRGAVDVASYSGSDWDGLDLARAAGVVMVAQDPTALAPALADPVFRSRVSFGVKHAPAVLADRHLAAALGSWWSPKADPTGRNYEDEAIAYFRADDAQWQRGLGLIDVNLVPTLTYDYRWGRLYDLGRVAPAQLAVGLGEDTALVLGPGRTEVVGTGSVVVLDARAARYRVAPSGALGADNVVLDVFAPGDQVRSER
jgi:cyanophycinase